MSKLLITKYHNQLHEMINAGGARNETSLTFAFANLLRAYAEKKNLQLVEQHSIEGRKGATIRPDGTLRYFGGMKIGYWEAKDGKDKLDYEIDKKLNIDGYPTSNIIFEDTQTAVLIQEGAEVMRVSMSEWNLLDDLLDKFINFEPAEVKEFNKALEKFKENVPSIVEGLRELMEREAETNQTFREVRDVFLEIARSEINPEITAEDVREMIIQHILTEDIFTNVFADAEFHRSNNIARELENVIETFMTREVRRNYLEHIKSFYNAIRDAASGITDNHEKQKFLKTVYENFYKVYNPKGADKLGVVYTPNEIVRFMIDSTDWLLDKHFNKTLSDKGVDILDPATGTGTFIAELIDRIGIHDLEYKYEHELHANEVAILPYYIANLNIEYTYQQRKGAYKEFRNICFVDTLDNTDALDYKGRTKSLNFGLSKENALRIIKQNEKDISVIIGNPPYNANQKNYNEFNANRKYDKIDRRYKDTFVRFSKAKKHKYDVYLKFYRWAIDRLDGRNGIIAFITNRGFLKDRGTDGFRKEIEESFSHAYIIDTKSDVIENPKIAGTTHNVFGIKEGVAITFLVKREKQSTPAHKCKIYYISFEDEWLKHEKLQWFKDRNIENIGFERIEPDKNHNWLENPDEDSDFETFLPLIDEDVKRGKRSVGAIFKNYSLGVVTARDEWVYDYKKEDLKEKVNYLIKVYNKDLIAFKKYKKEDIKKAIGNRDKAGEIKWTRAVINDIANKKLFEFKNELIIKSAYRPFVNSNLYFARELNEMQYKMRDVFIGNNDVITFSGNGSSKPFQVLAQNSVFSHDLLEKTQGLPLYIYDSEGQKHENITDWALNQFQTHYKESNGATITKQDIFYYVYAVLHSPQYRKKYEQNLKREFPRLPFYADFHQWTTWGAALMDLHINYETQKSFALGRNDLDLTAKRKIKQENLFAGKPETENESFVAKVQTKLRADKEAGTIQIDSTTTLTGVPKLAWEYKLGNRSAIEWILDQYKEKTPQDATIRERFNTYKFADYKDQTIDLLMRVCNVSVKTMEIVNQMPVE